MSTLILSDSQNTATKLRQALARHGRDCPINNVVSLENAVGWLTNGHVQPDLIFVVLSLDLDRSLQPVQQARKTTEAKIIAVGAANDPQGILDALHAGADDYLDENGDLSVQMENSLQRLQMKRRTPSAEARILAITSVCGGSGASVVAANLATLLARQFGSCGLLDFDVRKGDQAVLFNLTPRHTIADLCSNLETLDRNMLEQSLVKHESGVHLLAAPAGLRDINQVTPAGIRKIIQVARASFPVLVVDYPDFLDEARSDLFQTAHAVLPVFRVDFAALLNLRKILDYWEESEVDPSRIHLIANRCGQLKELPPGKIESALQRSIMLSVPDDPASVNVSVNCGMPAVLEAPRSDFARSMSELAEKLELVAPAAVPARRSLSGFLASLREKCIPRQSSVPSSSLA